MRSDLKDRFKKVIAALVCGSALIGMSGCMLFDKTDYEMTDAGILLCRALKRHDAEEILDLDLDEADARKAELRNDLNFSENGPYMPGTASAYDSICATMRYHIEDGSVELSSNKKSGEATFIFEFKDYKEVRRHRDNMSDPVTFTAALAASDDIDEVEVTMEFEYSGGEWKVTNFNEVYDAVFSFLGEEFEFISPLQGKIRSLEWQNSERYEAYAYYSNATSIELDLTPIGHDEGWDDVFYVVTFSDDGTEEHATRVYTGDATLNAVYGTSQGADMTGSAMREGYYTITFLDGYGTVLDSSTCYVVNYSY
ncbi:MAG: hypothetical protein J5685_09760 [Clostridiales bacterium]|nr:hypothetical protein [Clostridiales bacterium]